MTEEPSSVDILLELMGQQGLRESGTAYIFLLMSCEI